MPEQRVMDNLQVSLFPAMDLSKLQGQAPEAALRHAIASLFRTWWCQPAH